MGLIDRFRRPADADQPFRQKLVDLVFGVLRDADGRIHVEDAISAAATIVGVNLFGALSESEVVQAQAQIRNLKTALTSYRISFNKFPTTSEGLKALVENSKNKSFLDGTEVPNDPWGNPYVYTCEDGKKFKIVSYGADGVPGGTGEDDDIDSDKLGGKE